MTLISALGLVPRATAPADPELVAARKHAVYRSGLSLRDAAADIAAAFIIILPTLPVKTRPKNMEFRWELPISPIAEWGKLFPLMDEFYEMIQDEYMKPARITIEAELTRANLMRYKVKGIVLDPEKSAFVVTLHWVKEPSRFVKLLRSRSH